jgi:hypothetical protein
MYPPISPNDIFPDYGRINEYGDFTEDEYNTSYEKYKLGVFYDVYCVAIGKKKLAGVDLTTKDSMIFIKKSINENNINKENVNKSINYMNHIKIPCIQWNGEGNYLRNIYYNKNDENGFENAMKLILILHTDYYDINELEYHISIGFLLGYKPKRIKGFILRNINYREYVISQKELDSYIKNTIEFIKSLNFRKYKIMKLYPQIKFICGLINLK